jgi:serine/threonine protein kinase
MTHNPIADEDREARLTEVLLAYLEARQAGEMSDRGQILAAHPDIQQELEDFFACNDEVERLAAGLQNPIELELQVQSTDEPIPDIGQLGDFRLLREIGRGGMGVVYEAEQVSLRRRVALKVLPFAAALDPRQLQRFKNEALAAAHLRHENIVPVHAVGEERGVHFYAMQFVEGQSLAALIASLRSQESGVRSQGSKRVDSGTTRRLGSDSCPLTPDSCFLTPAWVARLGRQAALALEHAHGVGIVHRDIKPANLLLDAQGLLWITDFGLAQMAGDSGVTITGEMLGTLRYASPEQVRARRGVVDHRSDIYSLGATLYELLTLRPLFESRDRNELLRQIADEEPRPPRSIDSSIPLELETVVLKALGKEPSERYSTAREMADDLERFLDNRPILARRPTTIERLWKWGRRHPSLVGAGILVLLLLLAASLVSTFLIRSEQERTVAERQKAEEAYRRERQRAAQAEARFRLARSSVDEMFRISQEELADRPGLERLRRRMLWSVLAYYQEFVEQRRDEPEAQADLLQAKQRVENVLADLAVLRAASQLYLLCQPAVLDDLRITDEQRPKVKEFCARVGKEWMESLNEAKRISLTESGRRALERARAYEIEVKVLLTAEQQVRLRQIGLQAEGTVAFGEPEVVSELQLTVEQREQIRAIEEEFFTSWMRGPRPGNAPAETGKQVNERILAVLTKEQLKRWRTVSGEPTKAPITPFPPPPVPQAANPRTDQR